MALVLLTALAVTGTLGDQKADEQKLRIVQWELERTADGLRPVSQNRELLPIAGEDSTKETVRIKDSFAEADEENQAVWVTISAEAELYNAESARDHMVVITNIGNVTGYIRTWLAFEMGDLTEREFAAWVHLNRNTDAWDWGEMTYGTQIDGNRYAVVCASYRDGLAAGATTAPSLWQVLLDSAVSNEITVRLDGNGDGRYEIKATSLAVSDPGAWGSASLPHPWQTKAADQS